MPTYQTIVGAFNENTSTSNTKIAAQFHATNSTGSAWNNSSSQYQANTCCDGDDRVYIFGNYNNDTLSGSGRTFYYNTVESSIYSTSYGLGNISQHTPFTHSVTHKGYPKAISAKTLTGPTSFSTDSSSGNLTVTGWKDKSYASIGTLQKVYSINDDILAVCYLKTDGTYEINYGSSDGTSYSNMTNTAAVPKLPLQIVYNNNVYLMCYEDGSIGVRSTLDSEDAITYQTNFMSSYSGATLKDIRVLNNRLIFTGHYASGSFVANYSSL